MTRFRALIIDDETDIRTLVAMTLNRMELECFQAGSVAEARQQLQQRSYHFCITDMKLPDGNGLDLIQLCQQKFPDMPVAMITAYGNMELGVGAMKAGAFDVVAKPIDTERLRQLARQALQLSKVPVHLETLPSAIGLIGDSAPMQSLKEQIFKVARTQAPVFIFGEDGSGKELAARLIHHQSSRAQRPLVSLSCREHSPAELEQALFGEHNPADGLLYAADGGTLLLTDIDQLPPECQGRLLRVLQDKTLSDPRQEQHLAVDFRLLSASDKDLSQLVQQGQFRQDLLFRLNVITLNVPALREHPQDIPLLANHFMRLYCRQWSMPELTLQADALDALQHYAFPGNVSELENLLQRVVTLAEGDSISAADLQLQTGPQELMPAVQGRIDTSNLEDYLENIERRAITQALTATRWNKTAAADKLGISFRALRYRCKKLGID
ncbi:response regulator [Oceanospirillaceae bacterium ASx5O]|nr:response regulator [Oceanospirillaceae bacterium ASx5O]